MQNYNITTLHGLTPCYTAPEVFSRIKASTTNVSFDLETKADIYSYGVIIWEVFTRKKPWLNCEFFYLKNHLVLLEIFFDSLNDFFFV